MSEREDLADWLETTAANNRFGWTWDAVNAFKRSAALLRQSPAPVQVTEAKALEWLRAAKVSPGLERALVYQQWKDGIDIDVPTADLMSLFRVALEAALQAGVPSGLRYMLDKYKPKCCLGIENCDGSHYGPNAPSHSQADCCMIRAMLAAAPAPGEGR